MKDRSRRPPGHKSESARTKPDIFKPRASRLLSASLSQIGTPGRQEFVPDPFQLQALTKLRQSDVLVSAPTGSGKTWIAQKAIEHYLETRQRVWYASPLKALSNSKLLEFAKIFGESEVGILTGDRKENQGAPLIVGTTEILRNQLYDAMHLGHSLPFSLIILDEAHYLGDNDRGVVWEEVLIYLPPRIRLLLLSATIANSQQIAQWLEYIRNAACQVVYSKVRPVPLKPLFLFPQGQLVPLQDKKGALLPPVRAFAATQRASHPSMSNTLAALQQFNLLPAIFFLKSRADCQRALSLAGQTVLTIDDESRQRLRQIVDDFLLRFPFLARQESISWLIDRHLATHHAGLLPHLKLLVETLMHNGLLKAIFSTSTVAAGVNFPARTVVVSQSDRFDGQDFSQLNAAELTQMTGRAGRRGMDKIGFALLLPGPFQDLAYMARLFQAEPEPIKSQLHINFSMVLNLLLSHRPADIKKMLELSLAAWQAGKQNRPAPRIKAGRQRLTPLLRNAQCHSAAEVLVRGNQLRSLREDCQKLERLEREPLLSLGCWQALERGRVFVSLRMLPFAVLKREDSSANPGVWGVGLLPDKRLRRGYPRVEFIARDDIYKLYADVIALPQEDRGRNLARSLENYELEGKRKLNEAQLNRLGQKARQWLAERKQAAELRLAKIPCQNCLLRRECADKLSELSQLASSLRLAEETDAAGRLWFEFVRHLEFLRSEEYVDATGGLTPDGHWASSLRLNQPILIAQAIRGNALPTHDPILLAALLALLTDNREARDSTVVISDKLRASCQQLIDILQPVRQRLLEWGFDPPLHTPAAAAAVHAWGKMADLERVSEIYGAGEGDVAQLIFRVADNLRQLMNLANTHPALARCAGQAEELLIRPPILLPA